MKNPTKLLLAFLLGIVAAACGGDPFQIEWEENPQEALLFSLDRDELNRPSAFSMSDRRRVVLESAGAQGRWDFAVERDGDGLVLLPPRVLGVTSRAGIVPFPGMDWDDIREAPRDTAVYVMEEPVPVEMGTVYVVRTHEQPDLFGRRCVFFGRMEPLEVDVEAGTLRFLHDTSPECNNRRLVPPGS